MGIDFNNLRMQIAYSLDNVIKTLNNGILPENTFDTHVGAYCTDINSYPSYLNLKP